MDMADDLTPPSRHPNAYNNHVQHAQHIQHAPTTNPNHVGFVPQYGYSDPNSQMHTPMDSHDLPHPNLIPNHVCQYQ